MFRKKAGVRRRQVHWSGIADEPDRTPGKPVIERSDRQRLLFVIAAIRQQQNRQAPRTRRPGDLQAPDRGARGTVPAVIVAARQLRYLSAIAGKWRSAMQLPHVGNRK